MNPPTSRPTVLLAHKGAELYGSDRVLLETADALHQADWQVVVTLPQDGRLADELRARAIEVVVCPMVVVRRSHLSGAGPLRLLVETLRSIRPGVRLLRRVQPDIVLVSTVIVPFWLPLARELRIPSIMHVHEAEESAPRAQQIAMTAPMLLARLLIVNSAFTAGVVGASDPSARRPVPRGAQPGPRSARPDLSTSEHRRPGQAPLRGPHLGTQGGARRRRRHGDARRP